MKSRYVLLRPHQNRIFCCFFFLKAILSAQIHACRQAGLPFSYEKASRFQPADTVLTDALQNPDQAFCSKAMTSSFFRTLP